MKVADEQCKADFESEILKVQKLMKNLVKSKLQEIVTSEELNDDEDNSSKNFDLDAEEVFRSLPEVKSTLNKQFSTIIEISK